MIFCYFLAASNSERITKFASKAKQKDQTKQRFAWNWMNSLKHLTFQFLETCRMVGFRYGAPQSCSVVLANILGSAWVRICVRCSQRDRRGFGFRLVIYVYFRGGFWMQDKGTINEKQIWNLVYLLVLEEGDSADTLKLSCQILPMLGSWKKASQLKFVTFCIIS